MSKLKFYGFKSFNFSNQDMAFVFEVSSVLSVLLVELESH